jgi:hypothetical protein
MRWFNWSLAVMLLLPGTVLASDGVRPDALLAQASAGMQVKKYTIFFDWNKATLTPEARQIVATAADEFIRTGQAKIVATGYTDTSGSPDYNMGLSQRRAEAVKEELVRLGVPAANIMTRGEGETNLLVPTGDGVREAQNRRVEIEVPAAPPAAPPPVAAAPPPPAPPPPAPAPAPKKWAVALGPWHGYNLRENDKPHDTKSQLVGINLSTDYMATPNVPISLDLVGYNTIGTSQSDGYGGRATLGAAYQFNPTGSWHPHIGGHGGYIAGKGAEDGPLVGPEIGMKFDVSDTVYLYTKIGYDYLLRNEWDKGIITGGLGAGLRF